MIEIRLFKAREEESVRKSPDRGRDRKEEEESGPRKRAKSSDLACGDNVDVETKRAGVVRKVIFSSATTTSPLQ